MALQTSAAINSWVTLISGLTFGLALAFAHSGRSEPKAEVAAVSPATSVLQLVEALDATDPFSVQRVSELIGRPLDCAPFGGGRTASPSGQTVILGEAKGVICEATGVKLGDDVVGYLMLNRLNAEARLDLDDLRAHCVPTTKAAKYFRAGPPRRSCRDAACFSRTSHRPWGRLILNVMNDRDAKCLNSIYMSAAN